MTNQIKCNAEYTSFVSSITFPLEAFIAKLQCVLDDVPEEYKSSTKITLTSSPGVGINSIDLSIDYIRDETEEEKTQREASESEAKSMKELQERAEYLRLKGIYDKGNNP
jgi:hypothetical protein